MHTCRLSNTDAGYNRKGTKEAAEGGGGGSRSSKSAFSAVGSSSSSSSSTVPAKACPACGKRVENPAQGLVGSDTVMCGRTMLATTTTATAAAARSSDHFADAVARGGCGYIFSWATLRGADDQRGFLDREGEWVRGKNHLDATESPENSVGGGGGGAIGGTSGAMQRMASSESRLAALRLSESGVINSDDEENELL